MRARMFLGSSSMMASTSWERRGWDTRDDFQYPLLCLQHLFACCHIGYSCAVLINWDGTENHFWELPIRSGWNPWLNQLWLWQFLLRLLWQRHLTWPGCLERFSTFVFCVFLIFVALHICFSEKQSCRGLPRLSLTDWKQGTPTWSSTWTLIRNAAMMLWKPSLQVRTPCRIPMNMTLLTIAETSSRGFGKEKCKQWML